MKVVHKLLVRDDSTFEELTPQEQWTRSETDDIYRFLKKTWNSTGIPLQLDHGTSTPVSRTDNIRACSGCSSTDATSTGAASTAGTTTSTLIGSCSSSLPHSSLTPSTSGTWLCSWQLDLQWCQGASTSGTKTSPGTQNPSNLGTRNEINYKDLHIGASQFFGHEQFWKRCSKVSTDIPKLIIVIYCLLKIKPSTSSRKRDCCGIHMDR